MRHQVLDITVDYTRAGIPGTGSPRLYTYVRDASPEMAARPRPAVVICPGGGYGMTSDREAEPVALRFLELGFQCFIVRYTTAKQTVFPGQLLELAAAVAAVRRRAGEWGVDPDKIVVCGFSAGGHLAASLGTFWNRDFVTVPLGLQDGEAKPNGLILSYPVITSGAFAHRGSFENLLGGKYDEYRELTSLEKQVTKETPPAFIWHTVEDGCVPVENALLFAGALREKGVPFELHVLPKGPHGLSLATEETGMAMPSCARWPEWAALWIKSL